MSKFIIEWKDGGYITSYLDDLTSTSTDKCGTIDESIYEMESLFSKKMKNPSTEITESMLRLRELGEVDRLPVELIGINLMNGDELRSKVSSKFRNIASEYLSYVSKV